MPDLIAPHGGLTEPLNLTVSADEAASFKAEAAKLAKVPVSDADLSTIYRWGDGTLSPLTGPMDSKTFNRVLDESVIENNGKLYAWTIPLSLPVTKELASQLEEGAESYAHEFLGRHCGHARHQRHFRVGQAAVYQIGLFNRPHRSSRRRHGAQGRCR